MPGSGHPVSQVNVDIGNNMLVFKTMCNVDVN